MESPPSLTYQVIYSPFFIAAPGIHAAVETDAFSLKLSEMTADVWIKGTVESAEEARSIIDPYLRSWEMKAGAERGYPVFTFRFRGANIPLPDGRSRVTSSIDIGWHTSFARALDELPPLPTTVPSTPWGEAVWDRFCRYREGAEALVPTAYLCLTLLFAGASGEKRLKESKLSAAARVFGLPEKVLRKMGELTATPDLKHGRKIQGTPRSLSEQDLQFIEEALVRIVQAVISWDLAGP
jgi:hypothetical protein